MDEEYDYCSECIGYVNEYGELVSACDDCPHNGRSCYDDWDW